MLTGKSLDKKAAEEVFSTFGNVENPRYGTYATFPKGMVGKIIRHRGLDVSQMLSDLPRLFAGSVLAIIEPEYKKEGHKEHPNVLAYHHYVNKFTANGTTYYIRFSLREERTKEPQKPSAKRILHSTGISDIQIYEENKKDASSQRIRVSDPGEESKTSFIDYILAELFDSVNTASKVVDENGEPLVVYHGSDADFDVFDKTKERANMDIQGMFFSPWEIDAQGYGGHVRAFFLNIKNPANEGQGYKALNRYAGIKAREDLIANGYDGVNNDGEEFIAFKPTQIKSVDNNGNFSADDPNIYHQANGGRENNFAARQEKGGEKENKDSEEKFIDTFLKEKLPEDKRAIVEAKVNAAIEATLEGMTPDNVTDIRDAMPILEGLRTTYFNEGHLRLTEDDVEAAKDRAALWYGYARRCFDNDERTRRLLGRHAVGGQQGSVYRGGEKVSARNADRGLRKDGRRGIFVRENAEYSEIMNRFKKLIEEAKKHSENQGVFSNGVLEQSAWHGSPHIFDYFSLDAIGTGEGAQVHGWGLYFAKNRTTAGRYKRKLAQILRPKKVEYRFEING